MVLPVFTEVNMQILFIPASESVLKKTYVQHPLPGSSPRRSKTPESTPTFPKIAHARLENALPAAKVKDLLSLLKFMGPDEQRFMKNLCRA
jgi:hypothetical protein